MKNNLGKQRWENYLHRLLLQAIIVSKDPFFHQINISHLKFVNNFHTCQIFYTTHGNCNQALIQKQIASKIVLLKKILLKKWTHRHFPRLMFLPNENLLEAEKIHQMLVQDESSD